MGKPKSTVALILFLTALSPLPVWGAELQRKTLAAWDQYIQFAEKRIEAELDDESRFLATDFADAPSPQASRASLRRGDILIRKLETTDEQGRKVSVDDGMIHHWTGAIFVPGIPLDALLSWVQDYDQHQGYFQEIQKSRLLDRKGATFQVYFCLLRKKVVTAVYDTYHTIVYRNHGASRASSRSFTTKIAELENFGTPDEQEKPVGNDRGFLWRLNSYWRFQQVQGGVFVECESVSLSRGLPFGTGWALRGFLESVPRESLRNTLTSLRDGALKSMSQ